MSEIRQALAGRRVLLTGHTGFKGGWLSLWLGTLGARVTGIALPPPPGRSFFASVGVDRLVDHRIGDVRWPDAFEEAVAGLDPELIIHMAAQALVRPSYRSPVDTYLTNVVGTAVVLDAARRMPSLRAAIIVTSDKCYENHEWPWPYREADAMGGADPYSSSKGCAELVASAFRRSYFASPDAPHIATARAGNVFGGGDWAADRLVPDVIRAIMAGAPVVIRNPGSIRPWQHVLEPLSGYLLLAARLLGADGRRYAEGWNFGPEPHAFITVETLAKDLCRAWGPGAPELRLGERADPLHEAGMLTLDSSKARAALGWRPRLSQPDSIGMTAEWYRAFAAGGTDLRRLSEAQIESFSDHAAPAAELKICA